MASHYIGPGMLTRRGDTLDTLLRNLHNYSITDQNVSVPVEYCNCSLFTGTMCNFLIDNIMLDYHPQQQIPDTKWVRKQMTLVPDQLLHGQAIFVHFASPRKWTPENSR